MATLFVATIGGHLAELVDIADRLPYADDTRVWVTEDHPQSRSLLAEEDNVVYVPEVQPRDVPGVLRNVPVARRLQREWKFERVISTGSGTALSFLPYLAARGVRAHYVECATRVADTSLTGRILAVIPRISMHTQWPHRALGPWHYAGSVFDGFVSSPRETYGPVHRAVVTLGTMPDFEFRRFLDRLAPILGPCGTLERIQGTPVEVLWQTGCTPVTGLGIEARPFVPAAEMERAIRAADIVVSHAGTGSALTALHAGRFPVLVPRDPARGEVVDGHQALFAHELEKRGLAVHRDADDLTVDDLTFSSLHSVKRPGVLPPFDLAG